MEILNKGLLTLPVCAARHGRERSGVPQGGPMDPLSCLLANRLAGNSGGAAALEICLSMPTIRFLEQRSFALTGGDCGAILQRDGQEIPVPMGQTVLAKAGDILTGGMLRSGFRAYLAVSGGLLGIPLRSSPVRTGDRLAAGSSRPYRPLRLLHNPAVFPGNQAVIRVTPGVHAGHFSRAGLDTFCRSLYTYSTRSDRMGIRFEGPTVEFGPGRDGNIISEGVLPGDIQITSAGLPILMMADCQTVGGYAKIAHVITADLPAAAQLRPGSRVLFKAVPVWEAQELLRAQRREADSCIAPL